jgi:hypothetical protein
LKIERERGRLINREREKGNREIMVEREKET